jgi:hypothetical protein
VLDTETTPPIRGHQGYVGSTKFQQAAGTLHRKNRLLQRKGNQKPGCEYRNGEKASEPRGTQWWHLLAFAPLAYPEKLRL